MRTHSGNPSDAVESIPTRWSLSHAALGLALTLSLVFVSDAGAQQVSISVHESADSAAFIVPRAQYDIANAKVRSRDKSVALLLTDTTLVLQLTQRGMDRMDAEIRDSKGDGIGARFVARMLSAGVTGLLDHGVAYRLRSLRSARADGNRLILEDRDGHRVFENVEVNHSQLLEDLEPDEARRFAADVNRAIRRLQ
ncbi:MAG: hypothetical protein ABI601_14435 [bacterium]